METDQRIFSYPDVDMIMTASTYRRHTADYIAEFEAFDSQINAAFLQDWELAIDAAYSVPTDEITMDIMNQHANRVATSLSTELTVQGMTPAQIDARATTATQVLEPDTDKEHHKHEQLMLTRKHVSTMNQLWAYCQQVNKASKTCLPATKHC